MVDVELVRGLVAGQFPQWAGLPLAPVASDGTDNAIFRLGEGLSVRLPRYERAVGQIALERRWLPVLGPGLPVAVPEPVAVGVAARGYPFPWAVYRWLDGANPGRPDLLAVDLAGFLLALWDADTSGGPRAEADGRGGSLRGKDVSGPIAQLAGDYDPARLSAVWEADRAAPDWAGRPVWLHGDLHAGNLLAGRDGRLAVVLDWSCLAVGDPAADLIPAWVAFGPAARAAFRERLGVDEATWRRGRASAFAFGLGALSYYRTTNAYFAALGRYAIGQVLAET
ncbi:aminoglycoside phosphotransferase family protein [Dactylosporangium sp. CS-033363]|uniref:aminoglycoside phosphotransferase family protein n=1 Tax=Dactylosporangium sp. CS-033363 TaxID=3239935 RepID=UPI003D8ECAB0